MLNRETIYNAHGHKTGKYSKKSDVSDEEIEDSS